MIKGAIFDVDGTLLDSMGIWNEAGDRYLKKKNRIPEDNLTAILWTMSLNEASEYLGRTYEIPDPPQKIQADLIREITDFYLYEVQLKPGAREMLEELKSRDIPMIIATSSDRSYLEPAFKRLGISSYFQEIISGSEIGLNKRTPDIYRLCSSKIRTDIKETWVFEDTLFAVRSAKEGGFRVAGVHDLSSADEQAEIKALCDYYLADLRDFEFNKL